MNITQELLVTLKAARQEFYECCADTAGTPSEQHFAALLARCDAVIAKAESCFLCSPDNPPFDTLYEPPWNQVMIEVVDSLKKRHPKHRNTSAKVVAAKLTTILRDTPAPERAVLLRLIDSQHAKWCTSAEWTKDGGAFAKSLEAWLNPAKRLWENEPLPAAKTEYVDRYVESGGAA